MAQQNNYLNLAEAKAQPKQATNHLVILRLNEYGTSAFFICYSNYSASI